VPQSVHTPMSVGGCDVSLGLLRLTSDCRAASHALMRRAVCNVLKSESRSQELANSHSLLFSVPLTPVFIWNKLSNNSVTIAHACTAIQLVGFCEMLCTCCGLVADLLQTCCGSVVQLCLSTCSPAYRLYSLFWFTYL